MSLDKQRIVAIGIAAWEPTPINREKMDDIARRINEASRRAAFDLAYSVGDLVIRELYQGDLALWGKHGTKSPSYQLLASRSDLLLSPSALCRAVGVYALCERHGGRERWPKLSVSHLREVLMLETPLQEQFLRMADEEGWTVSHLRAEIAKKRPKRHRERSHGLAKTINDLKEFLSKRREHLIDPKVIQGLDGRKLQKVRQAVRLLREDLAQIESLLHIHGGNSKQR